MNRYSHEQVTDFCICCGPHKAKQVFRHLNKRGLNLSSAVRDLSKTPALLLACQGILQCVCRQMWFHAFTRGVCRNAHKLHSNKRGHPRAACCTFIIHVYPRLSHLKKKIGRLRHVVVARVRNRPTWVLCLAVLGLPAPSSLETLHAFCRSTASHDCIDH